MFATLRKCLLLLPPAMRWRWAMLVPFTLLAAVLETLGAAAVFMLIKILTDPAQAEALPLSGKLAALFQGSAGGPVVPVFTLFMMLFYVTKNSLLVWTAYLRSRIANNSAAWLAQSLLIGYLNDSYARHLRRSSAELIRNALDSTEITFRLVMNSAVNVATETLIVAGMIIFLLTATPLAALITIAVLLTVLIVLLRVTRNVSVGWGAQEQKLKQAGLQSLQHSLGGIREIKVMGREGFFIDVFSRIQARLAQVRTWQMTLGVGSGILVETLFACGLLLIVMLIMIQASGSSRDIVPLLGLYGYVGFRVIPSINRILMNVQYMRHGAAAVDHLWTDCTAFRDSPVRETAAAADALTFLDRLSLERVCYTYEEASRPTLQDLSLTIRYGESIGVVGPTGSGKSTLINLILGLLPPTQGRILADGQDIQDHLPAWRRKIGYVPQEIFLIDDTLRHNIAFGLAEDDIDPDRVQMAVRMAQLTQFVESLPEQFNTVVGERGARLSGGQRQRVAIARALYHDPELIIFDEATSALDTQTELAVSQAIQSLQGRKTLIIIAHRLSTVRHCDHLLFLQNGRNTDYGSFDELMDSNPEFRMMVAGSLRSPASKET